MSYVRFSLLSTNRQNWEECKLWNKSDLYR